MIAFARETIAEVWTEAQPLLAEHWHEVAFFNDIPLQPRHEAYQALEAHDALRIFTARAHGVLVGYLAFAVGRALHYASSLQANEDVLFLLPAYRTAGLGRGLLTFAHDQLRAEGVQVVTQHVKLAHDFGPLLASLDYRPMETIHVKRLDLPQPTH